MCIIFGNDCKYYSARNSEKIEYESTMRYYVNEQENQYQAHYYNKFDKFCNTIERIKI